MAAQSQKASVIPSPKGSAGSPSVAATAATVQASAPIELYMRELPPTCIDWSSDDGRQMFREALASGDMECYFPLAAQFTTQAEPAYCGLGTLAMVLNALNIDPGRVWKGIWRWYHEGMLDCCVPLDVVQEKGISMDTFACLARCNGAAATVVRVAPAEARNKPGGDADYARGLASFRSALQSAVRTRAGSFLVSSYSRKGLGQTGDGHFSPLAGYHAGRDMVLVLDVARFKYPPHWVAVDTLYQAMQRLDPDTSRPRGYVTVHRSAAVPLVLFAFGQGQASAGHTHGHHVFHNHGECCTPAARAEGAGPDDSHCGNCSGQGRSMSGATSQLAAAVAAIDSARIGGGEGAGERRSPVDAALRTAVQVLLSSGEAAMECRHPSHGHSHTATPAQAAQGLPLHVHAGGANGEGGQGSPALSAHTHASSPLLALSTAGDGLTLTDEAQCLTRLSREQVAAAAALLADVESLPLYGAVRRALEGEARQRAERGAAVRINGEGTDPTIATLATSSSPSRASGGSSRVLAYEEEHEHEEGKEGGKAACAHEPKSCVRVHTAHVLTTLLLTMYSPGASSPVAASDHAAAAVDVDAATAPRVDGGMDAHGQERREGPYERLLAEYQQYFPAHAEAGVSGAASATAADVLTRAAESGPGSAVPTQQPDGAWASAGTVLRATVAANLAAASPLVRAEVNLLRGQLLDTALGLVPGADE